MPPQTAPHYRIVVRGPIHPSWSEWFNGLVMMTRTEPDGACMTTLTGAIQDQAALRGILIRLWDLNLSLISLQSLDNPQPGQEPTTPEITGQ